MSEEKYYEIEMRLIIKAKSKREAERMIEERMDDIILGNEDIDFLYIEEAEFCEPCGRKKSRCPHGDEEEE